MDDDELVVGVRCLRVRVDVASLAVGCPTCVRDAEVAVDLGIVAVVLQDQC